MKRIQGSFGARDPEDEKRRVRESVLSNLLIFGLIVGIIRVGKFWNKIKMHKYLQIIIYYFCFSPSYIKSFITCPTIKEKEKTKLVKFY